MSIVGSKKATITHSMSIQITIENALLYPNLTHNLLSYKYIHKNVLHVITNEENNEEFLLITKSNRDGHDILERILFLQSRLYYTYIKLVSHVAYKLIFSEC
jgi:hypothetical protein